MLEAFHPGARRFNRVYGELFVTRDSQAEPAGFSSKAQEALSRKAAGNLDEVDLSFRKIASQLATLLRCAGGIKRRQIFS